MHLDARYVTMVENAYYYCNPPPAEKAVKKKRPPLQEYVRKLLYKDLSKVTTEKVVLLLCLSYPDCCWDPLGAQVKRRGAGPETTCEQRLVSRMRFESSSSER